MKQYLLDTNICIYFLKGLYQLDDIIEKAGVHNCFVSEITIAELKFDAENSDNPQKNSKVVRDFSKKFAILPIFTSLDLYAKEKSRLKKMGKLLDDFDLLIGAAAVTNHLILVTKNVSDFNRIHGIEIEDWTV